MKIDWTPSPQPHAHVGLIATDREAFGSRVADLLQQRYLGSVWARSLDDAQRWIERSSCRLIAYALIDDELPDGSGLDLAERIGRALPATRVALFGNAACENRAFAAFKAGYALLPHPSRRAALTDVLDSLAIRRGACELTATAGRDPGPAPFPCELDRHGLHASGAFVPLGRSDLRVLAFLLRRSPAFTSAAEIAVLMLQRRDQAARALVRRYVADTRANLGQHGWLIQTMPKFGYRIDPRARLSVLSHDVVSEL
jgi:DNA-binding response OmpR family regulator